jgi:signal transduction histidine kinase
MYGARAMSLTGSATGPEIEGSGSAEPPELHDPLSAILSALETIPDGRDGDPATRRARMLVKHQARRAVRILEDLFDVRAGAPGQVSIRTEVVELAEIVAGATEAVGHVLGSRGHRLTVTLPSEPVHLLVDPQRMERVLTNLLIHAALTTDPGGHIWLIAGTGAGQLVVLVRDNGRGIAPDLLPHVFDPHQPRASAEENDPNGSAPGLALVKSLVELHGGSVTAASAGRGAGAEFVVRLPVCARAGDGGSEVLEHARVVGRNSQAGRNPLTTSPHP